MKQTNATTDPAGLAIDFALADSSLDTILLGCSPSGVCAIFLGEDPDALVQALRQLYPGAKRVKDTDARPELRDALAAAVAFVDAPEQELSLKLDLHGTDFQRRVWHALCQVPLGERATYSEVARAIGQPSASRAVAGACAANRVSLAVPCHRIVRSDGGLSGYRWGVARKRALLAREAARHAPQQTLPNTQTPGIK